MSCGTTSPELTKVFRQLIVIAVERTRSSHAASPDIHAQNRAEVADLPEFARLRELVLSDSDLGRSVLPDLSWCNNDDDLEVAIHVALSKYIGFAVRSQLEAPDELFEQVFIRSCRDIERYWNTPLT